MHDTLLDNYGVFAFNGSKTGNAYADFLLGLPSTMTQDAPVRKTDNGGTSVCSRRTTTAPPAADARSRRPLRPAGPVHRSAEPKACLRAWPEVAGVPTAPEGLLFPGDPGIPRGIAHTDKNNIAPRVGVAWDPMGDGRMSVRAATGMFYGSITGNEWNTTADNQPFTVRQSFPTVKTLSDPYGNLREASVHFRSSTARGRRDSHPPRRTSVRPRIRLAALVPDERHRRAEVESFSVSASYVAISS